MFVGRYETIAESDLVILLISDSAMAANHDKVFAKLKKVGRSGNIGKAVVISSLGGSFS